MTAPTSTPTGQGQPSRTRPTAAQLAEILALVQAQAAIRQRFTQTAVAGALTAFRALGPDDWWDGGKVSAAITAALRVVQAAQTNAARSTDAYMARVMTLMSGQRVRPSGVIDVTKLRRAIPEQVARDLVDGRLQPAFHILGSTVDGPADDINKAVELAVRSAAAAAFLKPGHQYGRVADQYRSDVVTKGLTHEQAQGKALVRVESVAQTDVTLAVREQYHADLQRPEEERRKPTGWRRILHPELSQTGPCGLCVVAADRVYTTDQLKEIHDRCVCEVLPVYGAFDPGLTLNSDDLDRLYAAAGGTGGNPKRQQGRLKEIRIALAEHAELGPVLVDADQHFRGPVDVARRQLGRPEPADLRRHQLTQLERSVGDLRARAARGENLDRPIAWQESRIDELRRSLGLAVVG